MTKTCSRCGKEKPLEDFYKHKDNKDGRQGHCKVCIREQVKARRRRKGVKKHLTKTEGFSTDRYCKVCDTTKDWKHYYMEQDMCSECWREHLSRMALEASRRHHSSRQKSTVEDLLAAIDKAASKAKKNRTV